MAFQVHSNIVVMDLTAAQAAAKSCQLLELLCSCVGYQKQWAIVWAAPQIEQGWLLCEQRHCVSCDHICM